MSTRPGTQTIAQTLSWELPDRSLCIGRVYSDVPIGILILLYPQRRSTAFNPVLTGKHK
ncbi:MAG: hypothetical protein P2A85_14730 [Microcoleus anatoxicus]|uniref:hypothetical protein n=1 Tax=Microcoleus anatoxicus TaxID=2705319 RepID=UPI0036727B5B